MQDKHFRRFGPTRLPRLPSIEELAREIRASDEQRELERLREDCLPCEEQIKLERKWWTRIADHQAVRIEGLLSMIREVCPDCDTTTPNHE